jgi:hypothetical protein
MATMVPEDEVAYRAEPVQTSIHPVVEAWAAVRHQAGWAAPRLLDIERYPAYVELRHRTIVLLLLPELISPAA